MKPRKPKTSEPSLRDKLSAAFLEAFQSDFEANGVAAIEQLRNKSPDKYTEIAARLIAATEPQSQPTGFASCDSMEDIGVRLLESVGAPRDTITEAMVQAAINANDAFLERLAQIAQDAQMRIALNDAAPAGSG
jgi:hypothetical protein